VRRLGLLMLLAVLLAFVSLGQEHAPAAGDQSPSVAQKVEHVAEEGEGNLEIWKWANFFILAGILGWLIAKNAPAFFRSRTEEIQRGIAEAARIREDALARAAKMEARMASLQSEIEHLRADSKADMARETARLRSETETHLARIQTRGEQQIESVVKHAQRDLRIHSAQLALQLAEQRIRARMSGETQNALFDGFLKHLDEAARTQGVRQ
jgi:F-type H+-transporting ATPase subunit b